MLRPRFDNLLTRKLSQLQRRLQTPAPSETRRGRLLWLLPVLGWSAGLGVLMTLGFAPFFFWPLALASVALLFWLVVQASNGKRAMLVALVWGFAHHLTALYWLPRAFYLDADRSVMAGILGGVPALIGIAFYGAAGMVLVAYLAWRMPPRWRSVAFVLAWVALDMLKALTPYGFPWLPAGAVWAGDLLGGPIMMQLASVGGVFLLSALVLASAVLLAPVNRLTQRRRTLVAAVLLSAVAAFGLVRVSGAPGSATEQAAGQPTVRLVQPNVQSALKWDPQARLHYLGLTLDEAFGPAVSETAQVPSIVTTPAKAPDMVILPETAVAFYLASDPELRAAIGGRMANPAVISQTLLTGTVRRDSVLAPNGQELEPTFANSFVAMDARGRLLGSYDKILLVPFGEFIPGRFILDRLPLPALRTLSQSRLDYTPGTADPRLPTPQGVAESLICYEGIFPWHVARHSGGADLLVNVTNDNWFTGTTALFQHAALERLRTVETGLPLMRVANTGLTVAYDGYGREIARLPINTLTHVDVVLPKPVPGGTLFARLLGR